jgi:hypothetical protein
MAEVTLVLGVDPPSEILMTLAPAVIAALMPVAMSVSEKLQPPAGAAARAIGAQGRDGGAKGDAHDPHAIARARRDQRHHRAMVAVGLMSPRCPPDRSRRRDAPAELGV